MSKPEDKDRKTKKDDKDERRVPQAPVVRRPEGRTFRHRGMEKRG